MSASAFHRMPWILLGVIIGVFLGAAIYAMAQSEDRRKETPKVLAAQEFRLVDKEGNTKAVFGETGIGPGLLIGDKEGKPGIRITVAPDGSCLLWLLNSDHRTAVELRADSEEGWIRLVKTSKDRTIKP